MNNMTHDSYTYAESIRHALDECMTEDPKMINFGLGINDPKGIFGTTIGLGSKYGEERVFDTPTSENGMTGIGIGAAISGHAVVMTHQRLDFFLLAMDQLVNSAAKWYFMFGEKKSVPITIRLILGRGWGQGPTHCQNLHAWFAHIPGLKVVMPTFPNDAYNLLKASIKDPNPVIFLEHRWLHNSKWNIENGSITKIGKSRICRPGKDLTIVSSSYLTLEALKAAKYLEEHYRIKCEVIDLVSIKPLDSRAIQGSVTKTGGLLVLDSGHEICGLAAEIITQISVTMFKQLKVAPERLCMSDMPEATSYELTKSIYINSETITKKVLDMLNIQEGRVNHELTSNAHHDVPGQWFNGPF